MAKKSKFEMVKNFYEESQGRSSKGMDQPGEFQRDYRGGL